MGENGSPVLKVELPDEPDLSTSERESMDNISPHHDYDYDSTVSSETVPSYNQLNYNENIQRFFNSRPTTVGNRSANASASLMLNVTDNPEREQTFDESGHFSAASNLMLDIHQGTTSSTDSVGASRMVLMQASSLTEAQLLRHNDDMEKSLIKKHRECRNSISPSKKSAERKSDVIGLFSHGIKRAVARSWENDDPNKSTKIQHSAEGRMFSARLPNGMGIGGAVGGIGAGGIITSSGVDIPPTMHNVIVNSSVASNNIWPPCLLGTGSQVAVQTTQINQFAPPQSSIFPTTVYLLPTTPANASVPQLASMPSQATTSATAAVAAPSHQYMPYMTGLMHPYVYSILRVRV